MYMKFYFLPITSEKFYWSRNFSVQKDILHQYETRATTLGQSLAPFSRNGYLLHCMHKQQDFFGCLAEILGCLGLREAANLEIWPLRPRRGQEGQSFKVGSLEKALGQPKIEARPPKRSRCICIQYNRRFCCIFGQRFMTFHHQSLSSSVGRASGSHTTAPSSIPGFGIVF